MSNDNDYGKKIIIAIIAGVIVSILTGSFETGSIVGIILGLLFG